MFQAQNSRRLPKKVCLWYQSMHVCICVCMHGLCGRVYLFVSICMFASIHVCKSSVLGPVQCPQKKNIFDHNWPTNHRNVCSLSSPPSAHRPCQGLRKQFIFPSNSAPNRGVSMYVWMCMYVHAEPACSVQRIYVNICVYKYVSCIYVYMCKSMYVHICAYLSVHVCICVYVCFETRPCLYVCIYVCMHKPYVRCALYAWGAYALYTHEPQTRPGIILSGRTQRL